MIDVHLTGFLLICFATAHERPALENLTHPHQTFSTYIHLKEVLKNFLISNMYM